MAREFLGRCRGCLREFVRRVGGGSDGYCPVCNEESDRGLSGRDY